MVLLYWAAANMLNSRSGRAMMAIRDYPIAADTMGIDTSLYKTVTFGISAAYTGIAGALSAFTIAFVAPDSFNIFCPSSSDRPGGGGIGSLIGSVGVASSTCWSIIRRRRSRLSPRTTSACSSTCRPTPCSASC